MQPLIDVASARLILSRWLDPWIEWVREVERLDGSVHFKADFGHYLRSSGHSTYPYIYEAWPNLKERAHTALQTLAADNLTEEKIGIAFGTPEERGRFAYEFLEELDLLEPLIGPHLTGQEVAHAAASAAAFSETELASLKPFLDVLPSLMLAMFHEYASVAVHGVPLSTLIQRAKEGDDLAFGQAIQIDGSVLVVLPYFSDRYRRARAEGDVKFLRMVSAKTTAPPFKGRIQQMGVWLVIGILDFFGLLEKMSGPELLDFCTEVGANNGNCPIEDEKNILKRVATYKRYQKKT